MKASKIGAVLGILFVGASLYATAAFSDQGQAGWVCYAKNRNSGRGYRWFDPSAAKAQRDAMSACDMGGRYSCILVKCVSADKDDGCPECDRAH
jgi:hypothetical protein